MRGCPAGPGLPQVGLWGAGGEADGLQHPATCWQVCGLASRVWLGLLQVVVREGWTPSAGAGGLTGEGPARPPLQVPDQH